MTKKNTNVFYQKTSKSCPIFMKFILEVKNSTSNKIFKVDFRLNYLFPSTQTKNCFLTLLGSKFIISNIQKSLMCPCTLICSSGVALLYSEEKTEGYCVFFSRFYEKRHFQELFRPIFR
jgi:hypothetical protein